MLSTVAESSLLYSGATSSQNSGNGSASATDSTSAFDALVAAATSTLDGSTVTSNAATTAATATSAPATETLAGGFVTIPVIIPTDQGGQTTTVGQGQSTGTSSTASAGGIAVGAPVGKETGGVDVIDDWTSTEVPTDSSVSSAVVAEAPTSEVVSGVAETASLLATASGDGLSFLVQQASYTTTAYQSLLRLGQSADFET